MDDLNIVVLAGHLAAEPDLQRYPSGEARLRLRLSIVSEGPPRRVDVLPVTVWDPPPGAETMPLASEVTVGGVIRRRFRATPGGRASRLEILARQLWWAPADHPAPGDARYPPSLP